MNSIRLKGRHLVHSQTTCKVRILVCRKIASWTESISGGKNSVTVLSYNPKDTCSNIIHSIWPKAGAYFRGRSCAEFDSPYAVKKVSWKQYDTNKATVIEVFAQTSITWFEILVSYGFITLKTHTAIVSYFYIIRTWFYGVSCCLCYGIGKVIIQ